MSGRFNGEQQKVSEMLERKIPYMNCTPHGVNLVAEHGSSASILIVVLEKIFVFFTDSPKRNQHLLRCVNDWVKKLLVSSAFWESSEFRRTISVFFSEHGVDESGVYFIYAKSKILARNCFCINTDRGYSLFKGLYSIYWYCFPSVDSYSIYTVYIHI
jgi:hypothetical protein